MFTPSRLGTPKQNYSPFTPSRGSGSVGKVRTPKVFSRARASVSTPQSQRREQLGNWTFQSEETTSLQKLELFGGSLPVLVTEALTECDSNSELSVGVHSIGWAWLVWKRKLLLWKFKNVQIGRLSVCKELTLPPTDSTYTADLVTILPHLSDPNSIACVAVSPEGTVRYWSNVSMESSYVEISADVRTSKCAAVIPLKNFTCVLATTTSALILLMPARSQNQIQCRAMRVPQGMLSGIGRRMSSFIFGSVGTQAYEAPLYKLLAGEMLDDHTQAFYVLTGNHLQKWAVQGTAEKIMYQCPVEKIFADSISNAIWGEDSAQLSRLKVWLIDMEMAEDGILLLGAATNTDVSNEIHYGLGILHTEGADSPQSLLSFSSLPQLTAVLLDEDDIAPHAAYKLLFPSPATRGNTVVYLYNSNSITAVSVATTASQQHIDKVEFSSGDALLGAGACDQQALFFSASHGLVAMRSDAMPGAGDESAMDESQSPADMTASRSLLAGGDSGGSLEELATSQDHSQILKAAFIHYCRRNTGEAQSIVDDLFPASSASAETGNVGLDAIVTGLSQEMMDDHPAADPRWVESVPSAGTGATSSLILQHQLDDKLKAHEVLMSFLRAVNLFPRLTSLGGRYTRLLLREHAEKIVAAKALRELHTQYQPLIDKCIQGVIKRRGSDVTSGLTPQDVFYREVSRLGEVFCELLEYEDSLVTTGSLPPRDLVALVTTANNVLNTVLHQVTNYRLSNVSMYEGGGDHDDTVEDVSWTSSLGARGFRALLIAQHRITLSVALPEAGDAHERASLWQAAMELTDHTLAGFTAQLDSLNTGSQRHSEVVEEYEEQRTALIGPFLKEKQYEKAASLAEKYCDFEVLVRLCEETGSQDRLQRYMTQFHARGFADFVFKWYVDQGLSGKLMTSSLASHPQLARFLSQSDNKAMSWVHAVSAGRLAEAHTALHDLATHETDRVARKKTMLSLSKLCMLADDTQSASSEVLDVINDELDLITNQEQLPAEVLEAMGETSVETMRVLTPRELIEQYVSTDNRHANEFDFNKALDLLQYVDKSDSGEYEELLLTIWCRAIACDDWAAISADSGGNPTEGCRETVFFRTVELAVTQGRDLQQYLPGVDKILVSGLLGSLGTDKNFQYLVRAGYENIDRIYA